MIFRDRGSTFFLWCGIHSSSLLSCFPFIFLFLLLWFSCSHLLFCITWVLRHLISSPKGLSVLYNTLNMCDRLTAYSLMSNVGSFLLIWKRKHCLYYIYLMLVNKRFIWSWQQYLPFLVYQVEECDIPLSQESRILPTKDRYFLHFWHF
jgi:hypothetical protein